MTVAELEARMTPRELVQWGEWLDMKARAATPAPAEQQRRMGGGW